MGLNREYEQQSIFPIGEAITGLADKFIGQSYLEHLTNDSELPIGVDHVTFEPSCRNNWHIHREVTKFYWLLRVKVGTKKKESQLEL